MHKTIQKFKNRLNFILNPSFIEKKSILDSVEYIAKKYNNILKNKKLLDIGCGSKPYQNLFQTMHITYEGIDFEKYSTNLTYQLSKPDYYFNSNYMKSFRLRQFGKASYDIIVGFQILEHHAKPEVFFAEAARVLKKSGILIISFPFIWELHEEPYDYQRLTQYKIEQLCQENNLMIIEIIKRGNILSVTSQLINLSFLNTNLPKLLKKLILVILLIPFQCIAYVFDLFHVNPNRKIFLGYTIVIKKN